MIWKDPRFNRNLKQSKPAAPLKPKETFIVQKPTLTVNNVRQKINVLNHKGNLNKATDIAMKCVDIPLNELPFAMEYHVVNAGHRSLGNYSEASTMDITQTLKTSTATHIVLLGDDVMQYKQLDVILRACSVLNKRVIIKYAQCVNLSAIPDDLVDVIDLICVYKPRFRHKKHLHRIKSIVRVYPVPTELKPLPWFKRIWNRIWKKHKA